MHLIGRSHQDRDRWPERIRCGRTDFQWLELLVPGPRGVDVRPDHFRRAGWIRLDAPSRNGVSRRVARRLGAGLQSDRETLTTTQVEIRVSEPLLGEAEKRAV